MVRNPFSHAVDLPAAVRARLGTVLTRKPLAAAVAKDGSWLIGTQDALLLLSPAEPSATAGPGVRRVPWEQVERADWDREQGRLVLAEVGRFGEQRPEHGFEIEDPALLLQLIRERVTASVVLQRRVTVSGGRGLSVIARRPPQGSGEIIWAYQFDPGVDPGDPQVMAAAERGLRTAAEELGL